MAKESRYLTIDQSTSTTKVLLLDETGQVLDNVSRDHRQHFPQPGWVEHDAEEIWKNLLAACRELLTRNPQALDQLRGLSLSNQRETIVIFSRLNGRPLHPAIVWQCQRGEPICDKLRKANHQARVYSATGLRLEPYFSASKLTWLIREKPHLRAVLMEGGALVGTMDTYLVYRLTAGRIHATDTTNASRTLLFDIRKLTWDEELCELFEVPMQALPEVRDSGAEFGETDLHGVLPKPIPIRGVMGDSQASLLGHQCLKPGMGKVTLGSGSSVLVNVGEQLPQPGKGLVTALAWTVRAQPVYAIEGIITYSAATVAWLKDRLGLLKDVAESEILAAELENNGGVYLIPAFSGLGAPHWASDARAAIVGLSAHSTRAHVARAALESIAYQIADLLDSIEHSSNKKVELLHADGGPTANQWLMQFLADLTGVTVRVNPTSNLSPLGAFYAAQLGSGTKLPAIPETRDYTPTPNREWVAKSRAGWECALRQVLAGLEKP